MVAYVRTLLFLTLLLVTGCGDHSHSQQLDLPAVGLRTRDLPARTTPDAARFMSDSEDARRDGVPASLYALHGRVASYVQSFFHIPIDASAPSWMEREDDEITEYRTAADAGWGFRHVQQQLLVTGVQSNLSSATLANPTMHRYDYRPVRLARVGDMTTELQVTWPSDENAYTTRIVLFRRGTVVVRVRVVGTEGNIPWGPVLRLARLLDRRLQAALATTS